MSTSPPARRRRRPNRSGAPQAQPSELWRAVPDPPEPSTVAPLPDPTVLLRSLGTPPLPVQPGVADAYLAVVVGRAAGLAVALAAAAGLLEAEPEA